VPLPTPPRAPRRPEHLTLHGDERVDDWYWLRRRDDPEVMAYLEAENAYTDAVLAPLMPLRERIFEEIRSRVQETDVSAPVPDRAWEYVTRTYEELQYAVHCRRPRSGGEEQVVLDENAEAEGHDYFALGAFSVSPDHAVLAYAVDTTGGERHRLCFRDLTTGRVLDDTIEDVGFGAAWANDSATCFYTRLDDAMRPFEVWRHALGTPASSDVLVFREDDDRFFLAIGRSRSDAYIMIETASKTSSEALVVPADMPAGDAVVVTPRQADVEYSLEHHRDAEHGDRFLLVTNAGDSTNFKLVALREPGGEQTEVVPHRAEIRLEGVDAFSRHLVLTERVEGLIRLRVTEPDGHDGREVAFPDPVYTAWVGPNAEYDSTTLRYGYTSLVAPVTDIDYDLDARTATTVKVQPVRGGYDAANYTSERLWVPGADGTRVPVSLVHRRDVPIDGSAPALLYGYGSYEISMDAAFRASRLSLLDCGFVYAIAHVRGGGELGRSWYEQGRLEHKMNTFTDFIACAEELVARGYTSPARLVARGGSAGGLLMGAVTNLRPDLFAGIIAEVPFVDVLTTMLDPSLPLTITEWEEWGDPRRPEDYAWMKTYSPYDNVTAQAYPSMLVTTGLNDPRVQFWEPAKWVAKLRTQTTSDRPILLRTELGAGHGGPSGRHNAWREEAMILAFACDAVGITG
jgi:oligopeptidase B